MMENDIVVITFENCKRATNMWRVSRFKYIPEDMLLWMETKELSRLRKLKRTLQNSLGGSSDLRYNSVHKKDREWFCGKYSDLMESGTEKWNNLVESMEDIGWDESLPALIYITNHKTIPKIRDGHHRLGVALKLGIDLCPVTFLYRWKIK